MHIALLAGGNSSEREIALQSAAQIAEALDPEKYEVKVIDLHHRDWNWTAPDGTRYPVDKNDFSITTPKEGKRPFDYALVIIHGTPGENGMLQGYLEMMGIPHSSCSTTSSAITFDKISTKRAVRECGGVHLAREIFVRRGEQIDPKRVVTELGLPLFVKPNASGSSFGVTKVKSLEEIEPAITLAFTESDEVLIEECITGREMGCGVLVTKSEELLLPITEIVSKKEFFDYEAKYEQGMSDEITPADITDKVKRELNRATLLAYKACRCTGIVRVDFIVTPDGKPYLIEINSIPGMSSGSIIPKQARAMGLTLGELFDKVIEDTRKRR